MEINQKEQEILEELVGRISCEGDRAEEIIQERILKYNVQGYNTKTIYGKYKKHMEQYGVKVGMFEGNVNENYN